MAWESALEVFKTPSKFMRAVCYRRPHGHKRSMVPANLIQRKRRVYIEGRKRYDMQDKDTTVHQLNRCLSGSDFGNPVDAEVANPVCELGTCIEEGSKFVDVGLVLSCSRACPKPVAVLANDAVRRVIATRNPYDKNIATLMNRDHMGGKG
jgi:hypothetical protein